MACIGPRLLIIAAAFLVGACTPGLRVVDNVEVTPSRPLLLPVEFRVWQTIGGEVLPDPKAARDLTRLLRETLQAELPAGYCAVNGHEGLAGALALYRLVSAALLADPALADGSHSVGRGRSASSCGQALVLTGEWNAATGWLTLGSFEVASGRILRLAAVPLDRADPEALKRQTRRLLARWYP